MSNELTVTGDHSSPMPEAQTRGRELTPWGGVNVGAVSIEQERAIAEVQGKIMIAKRFPRSIASSTQEFLDACASPEFAQAAFYSVPNRGSGESIRFAEEGARCYGNFEFGHRELSRSDGKSEIEVYAWDVEKNNYSRRQITVMHVQDTKNGPKPLRDQADIDNRIANIASKQVRGRILALLPKALVEAGKAHCKRTLAGGSERPISQRIIDMTLAFGKLGVTGDMLNLHLGHKIEDTTIDELADLSGIWNAIKEGAKPSDFFGAGAKDAEDGDQSAAILDAAKAGLKGGKKADAAKAEPKADPKPAEEKPKEEPAAESKPAEAEKPATEAQAPAAEPEAAAAAEPAQEAAQEPTQAAPAPAMEQEAAPAPTPATEAAPAAKKESVF